jgi:glycerophosphoryl diester phosphodiesterase
MSSPIKLGGHRGLGCTDHSFYHFRDRATPVENTLLSIDTAFKAGAAYIETDAVMSKDGIVFALHNIVPEDHFFGAEKPDLFLNEMKFADIDQYRTGLNNKGRLALFSDILSLCHSHDTNALPWIINIELKGVQGSGQPYERNDYLETVADVIRKSKVSSSRILWSSFCLENIIRMSEYFPDSHYGMLFSEKPNPRAIYLNYKENPHYQYLPFDQASIKLVTQEWRQHAHAACHLKYAHPEITTVTSAMIQYCANHGISMNSWALFEQWNAERGQLYKNVAQQCAEQHISYTAITDYLAEMKQLSA